MSIDGIGAAVGSGGLAALWAGLAGDEFEESGASPLQGEGGVEIAHGPGLVIEGVDGHAGLEVVLDFGQGPELLERVITSW